MDWDWILDMMLKVGGLLTGLVGMIGGGLAWAARHTLVSQVDFEAWVTGHGNAHSALDRRLAEGETRFALLQSSLDHLPDHDDVAELKERITKVEGSVEALGERIDGLREVLERVERPLNLLVDHHMRGGK